MGTSLDRHFIPEPNSGCWLWTGAIGDNGYGNFGKSTNGKTKSFLAHRAVYEEVKGPIPEGLTLDHKCKTRPCVNPDHLEPVTLHENLLRKRANGHTHCPQGHEFTPENTIMKKCKGSYLARQCKACNSIYNKRRNSQRKGQL